MLNNAPLASKKGTDVSDALLKKLDGLMLMLARGGYESPHTKFMREWMEKHPEELDEQAKGRSLWWDKSPVSLADARDQAAATVPSKAYYYQPE